MTKLPRLFAGAFVLSGAIPAAAQTDFQPRERVIVTAPRLFEQPASASVTAGDAATRINAVNAEDLLKYLPDLVVRKRHAGDTQDPPATRTSGVGQSARSLIYADGILLSSPIGNNNSAASPHWGLVAPDDIARIDVLYGPFAARYAGGSVGAVIAITTAMPDRFEMRGKLTGALQDFDQYASRGDYGTAQLQASLGDRDGALAWRISLNHLDSDSQPLAYVTALRPAAPSASGTPVNGAFADLNRSGAPIAVIGAGGFEHQRQNTATAKLAYDNAPGLAFSYTASLFHQNDNAKAQTYLKDPGGNPLWSGTVNSAGYAYAVPASAFSNNIYDWDQSYLAQGLTLKSKGADWSWDAVISRTDYLNDEQRIPGLAMPAASTGGAGSIARLTGTAWTTFDLSVRHGDLSFGLHRDVVSLDLARFNTADWISGSAGALASASRGRTATNALWAEEQVAITPHLKAMLGGRLEQWRAFAGFNYSAAPALNVIQPARAGTFFSPKAALAWTADGWSLTASYGAAWRMPTVTELYQAVTTGPTLTSPDPNLKPEHANSFDLSARRDDEGGSWRVSLFDEEMANALIAQSAPLNGSATLYSYVQNIDLVRSRGAEIVVSREILPGLALGGSVTFVESRVARDRAFPGAEGQQTPQIPRWRATTTATWQARERLSLSLGLRAASRLYASIDNSDPVTHTFQGFDPYLVLDARARFQIDPAWSVALGADNLNGEHYFLFHPFPQRSFSLEIAYAP